MGRIIVLNDAARAVRSRAVVQARQRYIHVVQARKPLPAQELTRYAAVPRRSSAADRVEKTVWILALWATFIAFLVIRTPPDLGRSVVRFQCPPSQVVKPR